MPSVPTRLVGVPARGTNFQNQTWCYGHRFAQATPKNLPLLRSNRIDVAGSQSPLGTLRPSRPSHRSYAVRRPNSWCCNSDQVPGSRIVANKIQYPKKDIDGALGARWNYAKLLQLPLSMLTDDPCRTPDQSPWFFLSGLFLFNNTLTNSQQSLR